MRAFGLETKFILFYFELASEFTKKETAICGLYHSQFATLTQRYPLLLLYQQYFAKNIFFNHHH
jgi:hypothetical protein